MTHISSDDQRKEIAVGRDRKAALKVIVPRVFATAEFGAVAAHRKRTMIITKGGPFELNFSTDGDPVFYFRVLWNGHQVMTGNMIAGKSRPVGGYLRLFDWRRACDVRRWQSNSFDTFPSNGFEAGPPSEASVFLDKLLAR